MDKLLEQTQIAGLRKRFPHQLSGGEQQRVALVRALATQPSLLLLDEPLSHLDPELRDNVRTELLGLFKKTQTTALFVSHDTEDAMAMADRVIVMREGQAIQVGTPAEVYSKPLDRYAALLFGKTNFVPLDLIPNAPHHFQDEDSNEKVVSIRPHDWQVIERDSQAPTPQSAEECLQCVTKEPTWNLRSKWKPCAFWPTWKPRTGSWRVTK